MPARLPPSIARSNKQHSPPPRARLRNLQTRFAQTIDQVLAEFRIPPFPQLFTRSRSEVRSDRKQILHGVTRRFSFAELAIDGCKREMCAPEAGHVDFEGDVQRAAVVALAVS